MASGFGSEALEQLRSAERERFLELRAAILSAVSVPLRAVKALVAWRRRSWFSGLCSLADKARELSAQESALKEQLYAKYLYPLFDGTMAQKAAAHRRMNFEFERKRALIRIRRWATLFLWRIGRLIEEVWLWLGAHRPFKFIDFSWRATIVSLSTFALVGLALFTALDMQLLKSIPARDEGTRSTATVEPVEPSAVMVFPTGSLPIYWEVGSSTSVLIGFDGRDASLSKTPVVESICSTSAILAYGASSHQGSLARNKALARNRSVVLARHISAATSACAEQPLIIAVALSQPLDLIDDGSQRKAFAVGIGYAEWQERSGTKLIEIAEDGIDRARGESAKRYRSIELCEIRDGQVCHWDDVHHSGA